MELVQLDIKGISYSQTQNGAYALILSEVNGKRKLPIIIGGFEAQSIAIALEKEIKPPRPLTHDLFKNFAIRFAIQLKKVIIHKLVDGVFYSSIVCTHNKGEEVIDARTSDAIALALRFNAPIYTYPQILDEAGIYLSTKTKTNPSEKTSEKHIEKISDTQVTPSVTQKNLDPSFYKKHSLQELQTLLNEAVAQEDYEKAAYIRDEISKRSPNA